MSRWTTTFTPSGPATPSAFLYDAPLIGGDIAGNQGGVNQGGDAVGRDTNNG